MDLSNIYQDFTDNETAFLDDLLANRFRNNIMGQVDQDESIDRTRHLWLAIYANHLMSVDKTLTLSSERQYFRQSDLDYYFPTDPSSHTIANPFSYREGDGYYSIKFIHTTTGTKIYEYVDALVKAGVGYESKHSLAISLTESQNHRVQVIMSNNQAWILTNKFTNKLVLGVLTLFPFIFNIEELIKDESVINCCKAVANNEPIRPFMAKLLADAEDIQNKKKRNLLLNSLSAGQKQRLTQVEYDIKRKLNSIQDHNDSITNLYRQLDELYALQAGYKIQQPVNEEELTNILNYVENNKFIKSFTADKIAKYGGSVDALLLSIHTPVTIYEAEPIQRYIDRYEDDEYTEERVKKVLKAFRKIFVEEEYTMWTQTWVALDMADHDMYAKSQYTGKTDIDYTLIPQPHLTIYNCWGDNAGMIRKALSDSEFLGAINNILIATQNINFTDYTVLENFIRKIYQSEHIRTLPSLLCKADNSWYSMQDIINKIEEEENEGATALELHEDPPVI